MTMTVTLMKRITNEKQEQFAELIFSYYPTSVPRIGEILDGKYEIIQVIYETPTKVTLEVKEYDSAKRPLITELPLIET